MITEGVIRRGVNASLRHNGGGGADRILDSNAVVLVTKDRENEVDKLLTDQGIDRFLRAFGRSFTESIKQAHDGRMRSTSRWSKDLRVQAALKQGTRLARCRL